ncbi:MAG: sigma-70 family RNA polymerase sigma factor [Planctomycetaceae bacterium]
MSRTATVQSPRHSRSSLKAATKALISREINFIYHRDLLRDEFCVPHRALVAELLDVERRDEASTETADAVVGGWKLARLLTPDEEQSCFIAMNAALLRANKLRAKLDPARPSVRAMREMRSLLAEAEAARNRLVEGNVRLVLSVAGKMSNDLVSTEELIADGLLILLKAIDGFDYSRGYRFSTYATNSLHRHFFRLRNRTVRKQQLCRSIPSESLLHHTGSQGVELPADDPVQLVSRLLHQGEELLDDRERRILELRFGLAGTAHTLREIASVTKVSKERVRQLLTRAVDKLRQLAIDLRLEWATADGLVVPEPTA